VGDPAFAQMLATDGLRRQRLELLELASEVAPLLDAELLVSDSSGARLKMCDWILKLRRYLEKEQRSVYPRLFPHSDPRIVTRAARFQRDVRALGELIMVYADDWLATEMAIASYPSRFVEETRDIFELFSKRCRMDADRAEPRAPSLSMVAKR
jgi:hypothetical protein